MTSFPSGETDKHAGLNKSLHSHPSQPCIPRSLPTVNVYLNLVIQWPVKLWSSIMSLFLIHSRQIMELCYPTMTSIQSDFLARFINLYQTDKYARIALFSISNQGPTLSRRIPWFKLDVHFCSNGFRLYLVCLLNEATWHWSEHMSHWCLQQKYLTTYFPRFKICKFHENDRI